MGARKTETVGSYRKNGEAFTFTRIKGGGGRRRWQCSCGARGKWMDKSCHVPCLVHQWDAHCNEVHDASVQYEEPVKS